jgi:hypothetical protein
MATTTKADFIDKEVPLKDLLLDPNNYRFQDSPEFVPARDTRFHEDSIQQKAHKRLREESLEPLKASILANGFLPVERIVVTPYKHKANSYLIIEGNRRVAALTWIAEDLKAGVDVPPPVAATLKAVPVLCVKEHIGSDFHEALMGIRHVSGIKQWGGYQRAKLVSTMRDEHQIESTEIAARLGMSTREVNRRYRAFRALQQMAEADDYSEYATAKLYPIFHEAISLPSVRDWLGWDNEKASFQNPKELPKFYDLIVPSRRDDNDDDEPTEPKITTYSQVRELEEILANEEAKRVLFDPKRTMSDARNIANRDQIAKAWRAEVASALAALRGINVADLRELSPKDLQELAKLRDYSAQLLTDHERLTKQ